MRLICLCLLIWSWTARAQSYHIYHTDAAIVNIEYKTIFQTLYKSNSEVPITVRISNRTQDAQKWVAHAKVGWNLDASQIDTTLQVEAGQTRIFTIHFPCRDEYDYYSYYLFDVITPTDNSTR